MECAFNSKHLNAFPLSIVKADSILDKIRDSLGTKCYLKVIQCVVDTCLNKSLSLLQNMVCCIFLMAVATVVIVKLQLYFEK